MSAPHPTAIDTADPIPMRDFKPYAPGPRHCIPITETESESEVSQRTLAHPSESRTQGASPRGPRGLDPDPHIDRLAEIATLIRLLTYGEMMELSEGINTPADTLHKWSKER